MDKDTFVQLLQEEAKEYNKILATDNGDWIVKGFIDIFKNIYTITLDTKVVSKVIEILLIPAFETFAKKHDMTLELAPQQNFYPDLTFICNKTGAKFAVDIKSTMRDDKNRIKSMTLGAFTGYFRNRDSTKNTKYCYGEYCAHIVFGVVYAQVPDSVDEKKKYTIEELPLIKSVIRDFIFFVQPKYKIATDRPGSGNTKNIGAIANLKKLLAGEGKFATLGEEIFDDYWSFYLTKAMAKEIGIERPYTNLKTYTEYKEKGIEILKSQKALIAQQAEEDEFEEGEEEENE